MVFDLDDTLYLERDYVESGLRSVGDWAHRQLGVRNLGPEMIRCFRKGAQGRLFDEALVTKGFTASPCLIARMLQVYRQHRPRIRLADDALRLIARRPADVGLALITDGYLDAQKRKIRALGLHELGFDLAICTDRWGRQHWKPSPMAFSHVQTVFGVEPKACLYVADNVDKDFHAPKRLGWATVQIRRKRRLHIRTSKEAQDADYNLESLDLLNFSSVGVHK